MRSVKTSLILNRTIADMSGIEMRVDSRLLESPVPSSSPRNDTHDLLTTVRTTFDLEQMATKGWDDSFVFALVELFRFGL